MHDDRDIIFFCDDGSGGTATEYFKLDGGDTITRFARNLRANDNIALQVGVNGDAGIYHDGTNTVYSKRYRRFNYKKVTLMIKIFCFKVIMDQVVY